MPEKSPDVWAIIWNFIMLNANTIQGVFSAIFVSVLRIGFIGTEKIREFLFKFINKKVDNSSIGGGYE
ncbi:phage holin family protein [Pasteurella multocida]|uniref:hypothetical protein n=1 Tax=Pasteurella multocida TaxID=747 RepID=UPI0008FA16F2|nr:hypothetical protein [Pasteurella multocida]MDC4235847.1 phage holin family protein [Pasteurella multocida]OIQ13592.1 hypothetical protein UR07_09220 [Pasteurella multocida subsp. multocida]PNW19348.1 hypothetical protein AP056_11780 [Pasteurella multocida subsp. multocida]